MKLLIMLMLFAFSWGGLIPVAAEEGEIPITTSFPDALALFKQGRDLSERLRILEAIPYFEKAVARDPAFAMAYLSLANVQTSPKEFFENIHRAAALVDKISEGERLMILATKARADNNPVQQKDYLEKLVGGYPKDKRAHVVFGGYLFGQQDYASAITELNKAADLAPDYSPAYNLLGYAYVRTGNYPEAEKAFRKYTQLIPGESNPHDSYAEFLMKMGKFDESIQEYQKSLAINPKFMASYLGLGMDNILKGNHYEAVRLYRRMYEFAPDDGTRQQALFAIVMTHVDQAKFARAVAEQNSNYELSRKRNDVAAMVADLGTLGDLLIEVGPPDQAKARYEKAKEIADKSDVSPGVKEVADQLRLSGIVRVALRTKDIAAALAAAAEFRKAAERSKNPAFMQAYRQHAGMIALEEKKFNDALVELEKSDQRSPRTLFLLGQAYAAKGNKQKAKEFFTKAAHFNEINMEFAFVRAKAKQSLARY